MNGTAALHVALLVAGVEPDDEVLVSTLTFIAPANAIRYVGAWPVFIDAEPATGQMDPASGRGVPERRCVCSRRQARRPRDGPARARRSSRSTFSAIRSTWTRFWSVARAFGLAVSRTPPNPSARRTRAAASGSSADSRCFSFNGNKIITTGGGGMLVTDDEALAQKARYLTTQAKDDPVEFVHGEIGYNYRLTNVLAAIGVAQLERLDAYVARKRRIAARYAEACAGLPGLYVPRGGPMGPGDVLDVRRARRRRRVRLDSRALLRLLEARRIQTRPLWQPIHLSPAHAGAPRCGGAVAERSTANA